MTCCQFRCIDPIKIVTHYLPLHCDKTSKTWPLNFRLGSSPLGQVGGFPSTHLGKDLSSQIHFPVICLAMALNLRTLSPLSYPTYFTIITAHPIYLQAYYSLFYLHAGIPPSAHPMNVSFVSLPFGHVHFVGLHSLNAFFNFLLIFRSLFL